MTKNPEFQKELNEKIKPGVKASDIRKLKKSKSTGDLPNIPKSQPLQHSKSQLEIPVTQPSLEEQITNLKEQVKFHAETAQNYLTSLQTSQARVSELETDLSVIKAFNKDLQEKLKNSSVEELENSLIARQQNLKDWFSQYQKSKSLDAELSENIDQASEELISQEQTISYLRTEIRNLKREKQNLEKQLNLAKNNIPSLPNKNSDYLPIITLIITLLFLLKNEY